MSYIHDYVAELDGNQSVNNGKLGRQLAKGGGKGDKPKSVAVIPATASTGFGTATANPMTGQYGYTLDPRLAAMRDVFYGGAQDFLPTEEQQAFAQQVGGQGQGLFGTGSDFLNQALAVNPQEVGQQYYSDVQNLMRDDRATEEARLADTLFRSGRSGAATAYGGGYLNPEQFALLKAREQANQRLAIDAETLGRQRQAGDVQFAQGLQGLGLNQYGAGQDLRMQPYAQANQLFGYGTGIESLGFQPLNIATGAIQAQLALQQQQQAAENAKASGGKGGGLLGGVVQGVSGMNNMFGSGWGSNLLSAGADWYTGGLSSATGMGGGVGKEAWMYSDARLKKNITHIGKYDNGLNKYSFNYVWGEKGEGAIAQEVQEKIPEAVRENNGYLEVNYALLGE